MQLGYFLARLSQRLYLLSAQLQSLLAELQLVFLDALCHACLNVAPYFFLQSCLLFALVLFSYLQSRASLQILTTPPRNSTTSQNLTTAETTKTLSTYLTSLPNILVLGMCNRLSVCDIHTPLLAQPRRCARSRLCVCPGRQCYCDSNTFWATA